MSPTDMSAPHPAFEACSQCQDEERCWANGSCRIEDKVNAYANAMIKSDKLKAPYTYPGPYHPDDYMPDGRNMATTERGRKSDEHGS